MLRRIPIIFVGLSIVSCGGGEPETAGGSANQPPTIGGTPPAQVAINTPFDFTPTASDPEGGTLSFTVLAKPLWASFDPATGRLWGTPGAQDENTYPGIRITVSDGSNGTTLGPFTIAVVSHALGAVNVGWTAPTMNADGSQLQDLAGFNVYYGRAANDMPNVDRIENATVSTHRVQNLAPGRWFFAVTAFDLTDNESEISNVVDWTYTP